MNRFPGQLWARKIRVKVRYYSSAIISVPLSSVYTWAISGNSPYDPDFTFVGSVSNSWTTLTSLYGKYMCTYSKVTCVMQQIDNTISRVNLTTCKRTVTGASPGTLANAIAQPDVQNRWFFNNGQDNSPKMKVTSKGSTRGILGRNLDPSYDRVNMNADPAEEWVHLFQWWNSYTSAAQVFVAFYVSYWCELSEPTLASTT